MRVSKNKISKIRSIDSYAAVSTDVIVGFPGETDADFNDTYKFLTDLDASFYHVFSYSERPNTKSANFDKKNPKNIITKRSKKLRELAIKKQSSFYRQNIGKEAKVLFEAYKKDNLMYGYTGNYIRTETKYDKKLVGKIKKVKLESVLIKSLALRYSLFIPLLFNVSLIIKHDNLSPKLVK